MKLTLSVPHLMACQASMGIKDIRYYFNWIYLAPNGDMVATDGHRITWCAGSLPREVAEQIPDRYRLLRVKGLNKRMVFLELDVGAAVGTAADKLKITQCLVEYETDAYRYPDYMRVVPKSFGPVNEVGINVDYMADISKVFACVPSNFNCVRLRLGSAADKFDPVGSMLVATSSHNFYQGVLYGVMQARL